MTYDRQFLSIDWLFVIDGTDEVAATGINYSVAAGWTNAAAALVEIDASAANKTEIVEAMRDFLVPTNGLNWANYSKLIGVKIAAVGTDGKYLPSAANPVETPLAPTSTGTEAAVMPQSTVVISLRSGQSFGVANYGRMYIPHTRMGLAPGTPYADDAICNQVVAAAAVMINAVSSALADATTYELLPHIMTNKTGANAKTVAQVAVGNVVDTQRRRRNRLNEEYSFEIL